MASRSEYWLGGALLALLLAGAYFWYSGALGGRTQEQYVALARGFGEKKDWDGLEKLADEWVRSNKGGELALAVRGDARRMKGLHQQAAEDYQSSLKIKVEQPRIWTYFGLALFNIGNVDDAVAACENGTKLQADLAEAWYCLGAALSFQGNEKRLDEVAKQLEQLNPPLRRELQGFVVTRACVANPGKLPKWCAKPKN